MAPTLQKYLQISFALDDGYGSIDFLTLPIKPEELTRVEPSRVAVMNTLDGAWIDSFGRGLTQLNISGHTGWGQNNRPDGVRQFGVLRDEFVHRWHELRRARISRGDDPNDVRLIFIDPLNGDYVADVVPNQFTLRRSKSQPLLLLYNIGMIATSDTASNPFPELMEPMIPETDPGMALISMNASLGVLGQLRGGLGGILAGIGDFGASVRQLTDETLMPVISLAVEVIQTANDAKAVISSASQIAIDLAADLSSAAAVVFEAVAAVATIPEYAKSEVMLVKSAFSNLGCVLQNGYADAVGDALSYGGMYGASNCSSTTGGSPPSDFVLAGENPFQPMTLAPPLVLASPQAVTAISALRAYDVVQAIDQGYLTGLATQVNTGVSLA